MKKDSEMIYFFFTIILLLLAFMIYSLYTTIKKQSAQISIQADEIVKDRQFFSNLGTCTFSNGYKIYINPNDNCQSINSILQNSYQRPRSTMCMPLGGGAFTCF